MPNTFSQIYIQIVFAVKGRESLITSAWEEELYKYITGVVQMKDQKMLAINGVSDHIHFLIGLRPTCSIADLVREIKKSTNEFINERKFTKFKFSWQEGYGAFSYSHSHLTNVISYIMKQKEHHKTKTFREEYVSFLNAFEVSFDEKYLFEWIDE